MLGYPGSFLARWVREILAAAAECLDTSDFVGSTIQDSWVVVVADVCILLGDIA